MNTHSRQPRTLPPALLLLLALLIPQLRAAGQSTNQTPGNLTGTVLDAVTSQPIFRALVRLGGSATQRAVLTDAEGHFTFPEADPTGNLTITAVKPGYNFAQSPSDSASLNLQPGDLATPLRLTLYPEAILKVTLTDTTGEPLPNIAVTAFRDLYDESGHHWAAVAVASSNSHGHLRLPVPAGDYRIESAFLPSSTTAILPYSLPPPSATLGQQSLHVHSGEQLDLELHPTIAPLLDATIRLASGSPHEITSLSIIPADGQPFQVPTKTSESSSDLHASLPAGTYTLDAPHDTRDGDDQANVTLTPGQRQPVLIPLHFIPVSTIPLEVIVDDAAASAAVSAGTVLTPPNPRSLGLALEPVGAPPGRDSEAIRTLQSRYNNVSLIAPAGTYRLRVQPGRDWYILAATSGGTDLLTHDLLVASATPSPIQLTISNLHASLQGVTSLNGNPSRCWIYLIPTTPAAFSLIRLASSTDGSYLNTNLPPGTYRAIAFERRQQLNPDDPNALAPFSTHVSTITLQPGDKSTLNLDAVPNAELRP